MNKKHKLVTAISLFGFAAILIPAAFSLTYGIAGALIALGIVLIVYGVGVLLSMVD